MIIFRDEIQKERITYPVAVRRLRMFLQRKEPELIRILVNFWNLQGQAITYKEINEALIAGTLDQIYMEEWRQDYSRLIATELQPRWREAMREAVKDLERKYPDYYLDINAKNMTDWIQKRTAEMVVSTTQLQRDAISGLVERAIGPASELNMTVDELSRYIRPVVGLYPQQVTANLNYYNTVKKSLTELHSRTDAAKVEERAMELSKQYAKRQHMYRAQNIARTELAEAYRYGQHGGIIQAQERGLIGQLEKEWYTAGDGRVCPVCKKLHGMRIPMDAEFPHNSRWDKKAGGAHPSCRCIILYREV